MRQSKSSRSKKTRMQGIQAERGPYLTKRVLISATKKGFKQAAKDAMEMMGYVVVAMDGWVVKKYADGRIEKITEIEQIVLTNDKWFD